MTLDLYYLCLGLCKNIFLSLLCKCQLKPVNEFNHFSLIWKQQVVSTVSVQVHSYALTAIWHYVLLHSLVVCELNQMSAIWFGFYAGATKGVKLSGIFKN